MYRMVLDVEATSNRMVYDLGAVVIDAQGVIIKEYRALVREVFHGMADEMVTAYYADKLPSYYAELAAGTLEALPLCVIRSDVMEMLHDYAITQVWAYNASYDRDALNLTTDSISNGLRFEFMPDGIEWHCIHTLACIHVCNRHKFFSWARNHEEMAIKPETGNLRTGAEIVYRYLTQNDSFIETHTALCDARIEALILWRVLSRKQAYKATSKPSPGVWRIPNASYQEWNCNH